RGRVFWGSVLKRGFAEYLSRGPAAGDRQGNGAGMSYAAASGSDGDRRRTHRCRAAGGEGQRGASSSGRGDRCPTETSGHSRRETRGRKGGCPCEPIQRGGGYADTPSAALGNGQTFRPGNH